MHKLAWAAPFVAGSSALQSTRTRKCTPRRRRPPVCCAASARVGAGEVADASEISSPSGLVDELPLGDDPEFLPACETCQTTGFVPCKNCDATGVVKNERSSNVFFCPICVGHKKLRCPACGGKCYMCE